MLRKIEIGQIWTSIVLKYEVVAINIGTATFKSLLSGIVYEWDIIDGYVELPEHWRVTGPYKSDSIAGIPLDPTLPILEAGHLQDRMRRRKRA